LSVHTRDILATVERQGEQLRLAQKALQELRQAQISHEAQALAQAGETIEKRKLVIASFERRPVDELRALGGELRKMSGVIAILASFDGEKVSLSAVCSPDSRVSARELLTRLLAAIGGRGGGDQTLAQGGGPATEGQLHALLENARPVILEMSQKNG
jgi:alanyl-tRNA synthetase